MAIKLRIRGNSVKLKVGQESGIRLRATEGNPIFPDPYTGELIITPKAFEQTTLECEGKTMLGDVVVLEVPYYETHNTNGLTAYIASEV